MLLSSQIWKLLNIHFSTNYTSFNMWARQLVWNFKGYLWNSTQNTPPIHWKIQFIYIVENLTHWGRVTHIWVSKLIIIGSDNGLSPGQWRNIVNLGLGNKFQWNRNRIWKNRLKVSSAKWRRFCLNELRAPRSMSPQASLKCTSDQ